MTTIATDGKVMAGDMQLTDGGMRTMVNTKIRKVGSNLIGGAGYVEDVLLFMDWFENPQQKPPQITRQFEGLVANPDGIFLYGKRLVPIKIEEPYYAIGSGFGFAMGAMEAGASVVQAVNISCKRDSMSGLGIATIELKEKRKSTKKKASKKRSSS